MYLREFLLDGAQHVFVKLDAQVRVQAALHQHTGAAQLDHLFDFFVNGFQRQDVAVFRAERAIERAERAIFGAEIGVIDVAVNLVGRHARVRLRAAHFVRGHADADQIIGIEKFQRFLLCDAHVRLSLPAFRKSSIQDQRAERIDHAPWRAVEDDADAA